MSELPPASSTAALQTSPTPPRAIDWDAQVEYLRGLAAIVRDENLGEIIVEQDGIRLHLRSRRAALLASVASPMDAANLVVHEATGEAPWQEADAASIAAPPSPALTAIVSPMVGVYYRAKSPDDPPFVQIGDRVEIGQIVGLVEAMKTFNEITSEIEGEVVAMPIENGQLVETGATLISIQKL